MTTRAKAIVIGYGNPLRSDDAIGHHVVDVLESALDSSRHIELVKVHQLDITLAEEIASRNMVVFVDASVSSPGDQAVHVTPLTIEPAQPSHLSSHSLTCGSLLAMTGWLYGRVPKAALVTVRAQDLSHGETLSAEARNAVPQAARAVMDLLRALK